MPSRIKGGAMQRNPSAESETGTRLGVPASENASNPVKETDKMNYTFWRGELFAVTRGTSLARLVNALPASDAMRLRNWVGRWS